MKGDWQLKIRFTYVIKGISGADAKKMALKPDKLKGRGDNQADELPEEAIGGDPISRHLHRCTEAFKLFAYDAAEPEEIQDFLMDSKLSHFIDIEFPPTMKSICDPDEPYPFKDPIVWKRAREFLCSEGDPPPKVFEKDIEPGDIKQG